MTHNTSVNTPRIEEMKCRRCQIPLRDCHAKRWTYPLCVVDGTTWDQHVIGLSDFATLTAQHKEEVKKAVEAERERIVEWANDNAKKLSDPYPFPATYGYSGFISQSDLEDFLTPTNADKQ